MNGSARRGLRAVEAALLAVCCVLLILVVFPERTAEIVCRWFAPDTAITVTRVCFRPRGFDLHGALFVLNGRYCLTARVQSASLRCAPFGAATWEVSVDGAAIEYAFDAARQTSAPPRQAAPFSLRLPFSAFVSFSNCAVAVRDVASGQAFSATVAGAVTLPRRTAVNPRLTARLDAEDFLAPAGRVACRAGMDMRDQSASVACAWTNIAVAELLKAARLPNLVRTSSTCGEFASDLRFLAGGITLSNATLRFGANAARVQSSDKKQTATDLAANCALRVFCGFAPRAITNVSGVFALVRAAEGAVDVRAAHVAFDGVKATGVLVNATVVNGQVHAIVNAAEAFQGSAVCSAQFAEVAMAKPAGQKRLKHWAQLSVSNLDAGAVCDAFKLTGNRLRGAFSGAATESGRNQTILLLDGTLRSVSTGSFFFAAAAQHLDKILQDSLQQKGIHIAVESAREYCYDACTIRLGYDATNKQTLAQFDFSGQTERYTVPVAYTFSHPIVFEGTWIEAIELLKKFQ